MLTGTIVDAIAVLSGSLLGLSLKKLIGIFSSRLRFDCAELGDRLQRLIMQGLSLCTLYMGISGTLKGQNTLIAILSMVIGATVGEILDLDARMNRLGEVIQSKLSRVIPSDGKTSIAEGFVTASLLYCIGAMSIMGALNSGLTGDHSMLFAKSMLDGIASVVFSMTLGIGVALSAVSVFLYQSVITVAASFLAPLLSEVVIAEMTCVGSLMIIAVSLNMLGVTKIKAMNLVPALIPPIFLCTFM